MYRDSLGQLRDYPDNLFRNKKKFKEILEIQEDVNK